MREPRTEVFWRKDVEGVVLGTARALARGALEMSGQRGVGYRECMTDFTASLAVALGLEIKPADIHMLLSSGETRR